MSRTNAEPNLIVDRDGNGYAVIQYSEFHTRAHLWRVTGNERRSIATFSDDDEALAFLRWLVAAIGAKEREASAA